MKTLKYFLIAALSLMTCTLFTSCKDDANDWDSVANGAPNRQWSPINISPAAGDTYIEFSNFSISGATGYVIEAAPADDITIAPTEASFEVAGTQRLNVGKVSSEDVVKMDGLTPETSYYLRIKAVSAGKLDSTWLIYKKDSSGTMTYGTQTKKAGEQADSGDE